MKLLIKKVIRKKKIVLENMKFQVRKKNCEIFFIINSKHTLSLSYILSN